LLITVGPVRGKRQIVMVDHHDLKRCERHEIMKWDKLGTAATKPGPVEVLKRVCRPTGRADARIWPGALA
jgi:hypothetical protein